MIPFAVPNNGELVNLLNVTRVTIGDEGKTVTLHFTGGTSRQYIGAAAEILHREIGFCISTYRQMQQATEQAQSGIVKPQFTM